MKNHSKKLKSCLIILRFASITPCCKADPKAWIESKNIFYNKFLKLFPEENNNNVIKKN